MNISVIKNENINENGTTLLIINMEYITLFVDELVDKHGYDREILINTWCNLNPKFKVVKQKVTKVKKLCMYEIEYGKNKGQICQTWVKDPLKTTCAKHTQEAIKWDIFCRIDIAVSAAYKHLMFLFGNDEEYKYNFSGTVFNQLLNFVGNIYWSFL